MRGIRDHYKSLGKDVDGAFTRAAKQTSQIFWQLSQTEVASVGGPKITKYDPDYAKEVFDRIHPDGSAGFAAVQTDKMRASDMRQIRQALVEAQQESALTGLTARARQKLLGEKLATLAGGLDSWKFIDKSGKRWKNSNYFNMLNRTTLARVSRDSYQDSLIASKLDLVMVQNAGDPCPTCTRWNGVIYSITGTTKGFPSYRDAVMAGVFHPNCVCLPVYVDAAADAEIINAQEGTPNPGKATPEEWNKYATRIEAQALPKVGVKRPQRTALKNPDQGYLAAFARAEAEKKLRHLEKKVRHLKGLISSINRGDKKAWSKDPRMEGVKSNAHGHPVDFSIGDLYTEKRKLTRELESLQRDAEGATFVPAKTKEEAEKRLGSFVRFLKIGDSENPASLEKMNDVLKSAEFILGPHNLEINALSFHTQKDIPSNPIGRAHGAFSTVTTPAGEFGEYIEGKVTFSKSYFKNAASRQKQARAKYKETFEEGQANLMLLLGQEKHSLRFDHREKALQAIRSRIKEIERKLKRNEKEKKIAHGIADVAERPVEALAAHEFAHIVDYSTNNRARVIFKQEIENLRMPGDRPKKRESGINIQDVWVDSGEQPPVLLTEYADVDSSEYFAEAAAAIATGTDVDPRIKIAWDKTMIRIKGRKKWNPVKF